MSRSTPTQPAPTSTPEPDLTLMIGQMIMAGFRGMRLAAAPTFAEDIRSRRIGSVVFFDYDVPTRTFSRNVESPSQLKALSDEMQAVAHMPLLISIDQEGGIVNRLKESYGFPPSVSAQFLGEKDDLSLTRHYATEMAQTLAAAGINLNLAPVVDLNINPQSPAIGAHERSFGTDPALVTRHALELIRAHHEQGVLCTLKHFPGHGSAATDSHLGMVDVTKTWSEAELEPYRAIIEAGEADAIMTAHVFTPLDPANPATLSTATINGTLRQRLGWDGVVITDDMRMGAIVNNYGFETAILKTIEAGVDIIALSNNGLFYIDNLIEEAVAVIHKLVDEGKVSRERIEQSYTRIQRLKGKLA